MHKVANDLPKASSIKRSFWTKRNFVNQRDLYHSRHFAFTCGSQVRSPSAKRKRQASKIQGPYRWTRLFTDGWPATEFVELEFTEMKIILSFFHFDRIISVFQDSMRDRWLFISYSDFSVSEWTLTQKRNILVRRWSCLRWHLRSGVHSVDCVYLCEQRTDRRAAKRRTHFVFKIWWKKTKFEPRRFTLILVSEVYFLVYRTASINEEIYDHSFWCRCFRLWVLSQVEWKGKCFISKRILTTHFDKFSLLMKNKRFIRSAVKERNKWHFSMTLVWLNSWKASTVFIWCFSFFLFSTKNRNVRVFSND